MAIIAHFVNKTANKFRKTLVELPEIPDHTDKTMAKIFFNVLNNYKVSQLLKFVCTDNATFNDKALKLLEAELQKRDDLPYKWDFTFHRIRYLGHILNLAVQAFLFAEDQSAINKAEKQLNFNDNNVKSEAMFTSHLLITKTGFAETTPALVKFHNIRIHTRNSTHYYNRFISHAGGALPANNITR
jgi:hypothetical protein